MFFNKQIAEDIGAGDLYGMVDDGTWTIDKMFSLAITGSRDLDGDTKIKDGDIYGYITDKWMCYDAFIHSCDIKITERDKNGTPVLIGIRRRQNKRRHERRPCDLRKRRGVLLPVSPRWRS